MIRPPPRSPLFPYPPLFRSVSANPQGLSPAPEALETRPYANDSGPAAADGHHVVTGWVARVAVTLTPTRPWDIGGDRYPLRVAATYQVAGESRTFSAPAAVDAQVSSAIYEMGEIGRASGR